VFFGCGLLGEHISYSLSPRIIEWGLRACGLEGEYLLYDLPQDRAQELAGTSGWHGLNVTTPHKIAALSWCRGLTNRAKSVGAVNVLLRKNGVVWGDNTDVSGCEYALRRYSNLRREIRRALIIGSGGAARAVLIALNEVFAPQEVLIASRDPHAAAERLSLVAGHSLQVQCLSLSAAAEQLDSFDAVVQATPVESPLPEPLHFRRGALVMDLVYAPRLTRFLQAAERSGAQTENGLVMLIAQAAASFKIWTEHVFPLERALAELLPEFAAA
jgi:shikimate dehydrogenase